MAESFDELRLSCFERSFCGEKEIPSLALLAVTVHEQWHQNDVEAPHESP